MKMFAEVELRINILISRAEADVMDSPHDRHPYSRIPWLRPAVLARVPRLSWVSGPGLAKKPFTARRWSWELEASLEPVGTPVLYGIGCQAGTVSSEERVLGVEDELGAGGCGATAKL